MPKLNKIRKGNAAFATETPVDSLLKIGFSLRRCTLLTDNVVAQSV